MIEIFGGHTRNVRQAAEAANRRARAMGASSGGPMLTAREQQFGNLHGLTATEVARLRDRFEQHIPGAASRFATRSRADRFFDGLLPPGATLDPGAGAGLDASLRRASTRRTGAGGLPSGANLEGGLYQTSQRPYQPEVDSPDRQCFVKGSLVVMMDGTTRPIEAVRVGDRVLDRHGQTATVEAAWSSGIPETVTEIRLWGGTTLRTTHHHNYPAWVWPRECACGCGGAVAPGKCYVNHHHRRGGGVQLERVGGTERNYKCVPEGYSAHQKIHAEDLRAGDCLLMPRTYAASKRLTVPPELARLVGYYAAEGNIQSDRHVKFSFHEKEAETWVRDIQEIWGEEETTIGYTPEQHECHIYTKGENSRPLADMLTEHVGRGSQNLRLSSEVMGWSLDLKEELVRGYFRGDGHQSEREVNEGKGHAFTVSCVSISRDLIGQMQLVLAQLGYPSRRYSAPAFTDADGSFHQTRYILELGGQPARRLADLVWGAQSKSADRPAKIVFEGLRTDEQFVYIPIREVTTVANSEPVYNLSVSGDHSYLVENIATFNSYPIHKNLANIYWRLFYKLDPIIGCCVDLIAEMPWSDYTLGGVDGEVKEAYELMLEDLQFRAILPYFVREFLVIGEVAPHLFWSDEASVWTHVALHNPDQLEIIHAPFLRMDPLVEFKPDDRLRQVLSSSHPMLAAVRETIPEELKGALTSGQNIPLSPVNCTFIPRKLHPYDVRGTSIISRLWRTLMYEDCAPYDTPVGLADGSTAPLGTLVEGDIVLDKDGQPRRVETVVERSSDQLVRIKLRGGWEQKSTPNHFWPVVRAKDGPVEKVRASDIKLWDYLTISRGFVETKPDIPLAQARLLGYFVAEGCRAKINGYYGVCFNFGAHETDTWARDVAQICEELGCPTKTYVRGSGCVVRCALKASVWLADWLFCHGGEYSKYHQLSEEVMSWPLAYKEEFIKGYVRGDGSIKTNNQTQVTAATISPVLAYQVQRVAAHIGVFLGLRTHQPAGNDGRHRQPLTTLYATGTCARRLAKLVWNQDIEEPSGFFVRRDNVVIRDDYVLIPVKEVAVEVCDEPVYGITVEGDRSYSINNVGTYNSIFAASLAIARRNACFIGGTPVLTTAGIKPIEEVVIGDRVIAGDGSIQTVENAWAEVPDGDGLIEIKALGTQPIFCTPSHRFKVWAAPRHCACGCGTPIEATYATGQLRRRAFINGHHLRLLRDRTTGQMTKGANVGWTVYSTEPKIRAPEGYVPLQKLEARDIREGDYLVIPRTFEAVETSVTPEAARLLGYYVAEGSTARIYRGPVDARTVACEGIILTFSLAEADTWATDVVQCATKLGLSACLSPYVPGEETKMAESGREGRTTVALLRQKDESFADWLRTHGGGLQLHRRLSEEVMRWPLALKRELVTGYFRGDGHLGFIDGCPQVTAASVSQTLIYQLRIILAQLGCFGSISFNPRQGVGQENWNDCWIISSTGRDARTLASLIWGVEIDAPTRENGGGAARTWSDDAYVYVPVYVVDHHADDITTYNLSVSGDASYIAEGIQTFNSPLKIAKLGDQNTGWIPTPEQEARLLELLTASEMDPAAWLVWNYGIQFELVGAQERAWKIEASSEFIERQKLIALGISKSFLHGEVTYASAASGLTVFLQRLKAMREYFESVWIYPKLLRPVAEMNMWVRPTEAELAHRVRTKRGRREAADRYLVPTIEWNRPLDPSIDSAMISAFQALQGLGARFSKTTMNSLVNRDYETELRQIVRETKMEQDLLAKHPEVQSALAGGAEGGGGGGGGLSPGMPPSSLGLDEGGEGGEPPPPPPPEGGPPPAAGAGQDAAHGGTEVQGDSGSEHDDNGGWTKDVIDELAQVFEGDLSDEDPWARMLDDWRDAARAGHPSGIAALRALKAGDERETWSAIEEWLLVSGYPPREIRGLEAILGRRGILATPEAPREAAPAARGAREAVGERSDLFTGIR